MAREFLASVRGSVLGRAVGGGFRNAEGHCGAVAEHVRNFHPGLCGLVALDFCPPDHVIGYSFWIATVFGPILNRIQQTLLVKRYGGGRLFPEVRLRVGPKAPSAATDLLEFRDGPNPLGASVG